MIDNFAPTSTLSRARRQMPATSLRLLFVTISIALCLHSRSFADTFKADLNDDGILETVTIGATFVQIASSGKPARQYKISQWNYHGLAKLDDLPGQEIYFTNLRTLQGVGQPAQASVISYAANVVKTYDVGRPSQVQLRELDGEPGLEMVFSNLWVISGAPQPAQVSVINSRKRSLATYDVKKPNYMQFAELNGRPGDEMLFTNVRTISGSPQPGEATLVIYSLNLVVTYDVGRPNFVRLHELDGYAGLEAVFTNLWLIQGAAQPARVTVLNGRKRTITTSEVPAASAGYLEFADLDGLPGDEMLFTNVRLLQGVPQPSQATIVETREGIAKTFNVGRPNYVRLHELDGYAGLEAVFTNLWLIQGAAQPAQVTVLNGRKRTITTSNVPATSAGYVEFADLDGLPGDEMLFTNVRLFQGVAQPSQATIVETRERIAKTFNVGSPYTWNISDVSSAPGKEAVFTSKTGRVVISSANFLP